MVIAEHSDTITALIEHYPNIRMLEQEGIPGVVHAGTTEASFTWLSTPQPKETYTVDVGSSLSVKFDAHLPVRPNGVRWLPDVNEINTEKLISRLFGEKFRDAMTKARQDNSQIVASFVLTQSERLNLAELQVESASTPDRIRTCVGQMLVGRTVEPIIEISPSAVA